MLMWLYSGMVWYGMVGAVCVCVCACVCELVRVCVCMHALCTRMR